ncbi:hypothetical protein VTL71DRAFT_3780 [Oculimacula yallundae]|uniref:DUF6590 domain-containing protein n=1 Tax=Oculimacula yallundae TaxID=86028 RepID=A0ABR4C3Y8_9HELO
MSDRKGKKRHEAIHDDKVERKRGGESSGGGSASHAGSSRRDAPDIPRSGSLIPDPRDTPPSTIYSADSSRHGTKDRSRRESESRSTRPRMEKDYDTRAAPISIRSGSSKQYHDDGGYKRSGPVGSYDPADSHDKTRSSSTRRVSHSQQSPPSRDWIPEESSSELHEPMRKLTVNEISGKDYITSSKRDLSRPDHYDDERGLSSSPVLSRTNYDIQAGSSYDKGKQPARDTTPPHIGIPEASQRVVRGTDGETEELDETYTKRNKDWKKFFRAGRVFSTLWTEPFDDTLHSENSLFNSVKTYKVKFGQRVHSKIRRFVVVKTDDKSCTCLPVTTYGGRGYKKKGLNLNAHGLIYSSRKPPAPVRGITKQPLKINLTKGGEELKDHSYLHYGRVYTVEANVKVKEVGELDDASKKLLRRYYKEVQIESFPAESDSEQSMAPIQQGTSPVGSRTGPSLRNSVTNPGYDDGGAYGGRSGGYNQKNTYGDRGGPNPSMSTMDKSYGAQPFSANQAPSIASTFQYADVSHLGYGQQESTYGQNSAASGRGSSQQSYQLSGSSATGGFAPNQPLDPRYRYSSINDSRWPQDQPAQPSYSPATAPFVPSNTYPGQGASYPNAGDPRYSAQVPAGSYYNPHTSQGQSGAQDQYPTSASSTHQHMSGDGEIVLPTGDQAYYEQAQRRAGRGSDNGQDRGGGSRHYR